MRRGIEFAILLTSLIVPLVLVPSAHANPCITDVRGGVGYYGVKETCSTDPGGDPGAPGGNAPAADSPDPYTAYRWASICRSDPTIRPEELDCTAALACPDPNERLWQLWGRLPGGNWTTVTTGCFGGTPPVYEPPTVTPGDVLTALRRVGLPELTTLVQPEGKTLVNFDTNFYTEPHPVSLTLTLLGQRVEVQATPDSYHWDFGDGTAATTTNPGAAYPELAVTHRYADARVTVHPSVQTTYTARFRVAGEGWQDVGGTVTAAGPPTPLRIAEATGLLSGEHR